MASGYSERAGHIAGTAGKATLDALEPAITRLIHAAGSHGLLGVTSPLRELMLWRTETETRYDVELPEGRQPVTVVFMDDFASLGWAGFATCDRHHTGGWTKPDRLYAVRSAYDTGSENFRVSYLAHEAQHFFDNHRFPRLERQDLLEYRAKLAELAEADSTVYELLEISRPMSAPTPRCRTAMPMAGWWVTWARLFPGTAGAPAMEARRASGQINSAASALLHQDTARLAKERP